MPRAGVKGYSALVFNALALRSFATLPPLTALKPCIRGYLFKNKGVRGGVVFLL